jgi:hypothetical protein
VGITEALREENRTQCIIFHDVDLIPQYDGVPYNRCRLPTLLGSELEHHNWGIPYRNYFGGVMSMHVSHWRKVNGFSNDFWGWVGEDDDLYERVRINALLDSRTNEVHRPAKGKGRFRTISQASEHHPKKVIGEKEYSHSIKLLTEMRKGLGQPGWGGVRGPAPLRSARLTVSLAIKLTSRTTTIISSQSTSWAPPSTNT